jgi:inorganic phosphate transporter, PiT family
MLGLDTSLTILLVFCITAALAFEFINGFHDTANAVATVIYTHSLKPGIAVLWSGIWNFIGVNVGGIAVAIGIINLLPVEALTDTNIHHNLALVMALIITAIIWNIGTWYLGLPCSSSHTLIGSIAGVSVGFILLPNNHDVLLNWGKVKDAGLSLLISPVLGFTFAILLMFILRKSVKNKALFKEPPAKKAPPLWVRSLMILTSTFVSFSHGSNDGQKGIGLLMIILIAIVPARFALDHSRNPVSLKNEAESLQGLLSQVSRNELDRAASNAYDEVIMEADSLKKRLEGITAFSQLSKTACGRTRKGILVLSRKSDIMMNRFADQSGNVVTLDWKKQYSRHMSAMKTYTEYAPWWVILLISLSLGLGTMIGWKRIVITLGEKIGKTNLTYAQGATANLIAASTISASSYLGLPVSTTHVLSSGIAGTMVSGNGVKNLQARTLASIGIAWLITIPVTMLFSGMLFLLLRLLLI